ncbi:MAG: hypothetical protein HY698_13960 [Deltaproteobacteria bacterium]|nr:hypothetical protein [Deltaproteobacteria bacterium]
MSSVGRVEEIFRELGIHDRVTRVADNVWALQRGSATVQIVAAPEFVVATAKVADKLPAQNREGFFRVLLAANVQLLGAFFTLESNESIRINQVLPVDWLQAKELAFILGNVAMKADEWDDRIQSLTSA